MNPLLELADRVEAAKACDKALNREVALAIGWHRYSPSEIRKSNPGWIAPEDFIAETVGKDGRRHPVLDSLHGTSIWREPRDYLGSFDSALALVPKGWSYRVSSARPTSACATVVDPVCEDEMDEDRMHFADANGAALALTAASLRAIASMGSSG